MQIGGVEVLIQWIIANKSVKAKGDKSFINLHLVLGVLNKLPMNKKIIAKTSIDTILLSLKKSSDQSLWVKAENLVNKFKNIDKAKEKGQKQMDEQEKVPPPQKQFKPNSYGQQFQADSNHQNLNFQKQQQI